MCTYNKRDIIERIEVHESSCATTSSSTNILCSIVFLKCFLKCVVSSSEMLQRS